MWFICLLAYISVYLSHFVAFCSRFKSGLTRMLHSHAHSHLMSSHLAWVTLIFHPASEVRQRPQGSPNWGCRSFHAWSHLLAIAFRGRDQTQGEKKVWTVLCWLRSRRIRWANICARQSLCFADLVFSRPHNMIEAQPADLVCDSDPRPFSTTQQMQLVCIHYLQTQTALYICRCTLLKTGMHQCCCHDSTQCY